MRSCFILLILPLIAASLQSCFKKDKEIPAPVKGNVITDTIPMTDTYLYQVYFSLEAGNQVSSNTRTSSDLAFECSAEGYRIILNTSDFMRIADMGVREIGQAVDTAGAHWKFDKSDGNPDSTATGKWFTLAGSDTLSNGHIWALDLGKDQLGNVLGMRQIRFDSLKLGIYYFSYCGIQGGAISRGSVRKDSTVNYLYFNLRTGTVQNFEPFKQAWDLLFTQYTTLLFTDEGDPYPYLVTGVLSNRNGIQVSLDTTDSFSSMDLANARTRSYSAAMDAVGYDWKKYDFDAGSYTVRPGWFYLIRSRGYYYKLRFTGYYNNKGEKGFPVIEFQRL